MRLPRWLVVSLLIASVLAVLGAGAWWWVTWPERTAQTFVRLMNEDRWEEASHFVSALEERDWILQYGPHIHAWRVSNDFQSEGLMPVVPKHRSWSDICLGRQVFQLGVVTNYRVERGKVFIYFELPFD